MKSQPIFDYPVFALGFRAFFALAGLAALVLIVLWNAMFKGEWLGEHYFPGSVWHAHEMLLGYAVAVIAGFLLTAVKNWTGRPTLSGDALATLCLVWLYGRILPFYAGSLPDFLIALVDFAFLPFLAYHVSKPILATKQYGNFIFIGLLLLLALANGLIHLDMLGIKEGGAASGILLAVALIVVLILVIAGRVFPFFTERAIPGTLIIRNPLLDKLSVASAVIVFALQLFSVSGTLSALLAFAAAGLNGVRMATWYVRRIWYVPLLWVLYVGYVWIILGFFLSALSAYGIVSASLAMHAFTVGGIGVLTLGMMARVSLGHTGRALKASNTIAIAFVLINIATIFRVLLPVALPAWYGQLVYLSTLLWLAAFSLFVFVYGPILTRPRIDGQEG